MRSRRDGPSAQEKLEALHAKLIDAVADLASSEAWMRMLAAAARFHDYSPSNVLLIAAQRPDATHVAGIRTWNSLGRHVNRGEHGIAILAPCIYKNSDDGVSAVAPAEDAARGERDRAAVPPDVDGESEATRRVLRGFKIVHVFDVTQTDGEPLPDVTPRLLDGDGPQQLMDHLADLTTDAGYRLERGPCGAANGYTDFAARVVRLDDELSPAQATKTLAHELGHIRADHEHRFAEYATSMVCRGQAEVEAESIAYLVSAQAGLDAAEYSVPYVARWSGGDVDLLREAMTTVITVARAMAPPADAQESATAPIPRPQLSSSDLATAHAADHRSVVAVRN